MTPLNQGLSRRICSHYKVRPVHAGSVAINAFGRPSGSGLRHVCLALLSPKIWANFESPAQEADFLSYCELLETLRVPNGREVTFTAFAGWFERHRQSLSNALGDLDAHAVFEEFRGVISAVALGPLYPPSFLALGPRQSLLGSQAREASHALFQRYPLQARELLDAGVSLTVAQVADPGFDLGSLLAK